MFTLALILGLYAYTIQFIGKFNQLNFTFLTISLILFLITIFIYCYKIRKSIKLPNFNHLNTLQKIIVILLSLFFIVHLLGTLTPEIFYDALWYHLTLPKLFLQLNKITFLPGNLFYYSVMPQLGEMYYLVTLFFTNEIAAKSIHFLFALLILGAIYIFAKKYWGKSVALLACLIFFSDLAVSWQLTTAYIDLIRTFFEFLAFTYFYHWFKNRNNQSLIKSGILCGLAISTKYQAISSLFIIALLILIYSKKSRIKKILHFVLPSLLFSIYWFINAYINTGNPIYPIFSSHLDSSHNLIFPNPIHFILDFFKLSNLPNDWISPISPLYLILLPVAIYFTNKKKNLRPLALLLLLSYIIWFFIPRTGGSRFIVPFLPVFAIFTTSFFSCKYSHLKFYKKTALLTIFSVALINLALRAYINKKAVPFLLSKQTKQEFLVENLDLTHAFLDTDNYFENNLNKGDHVYFIGGKTLYYVDFPFSHASINNYQNEKYILTQYQDLPLEYSNYNLIYENPRTQVKLYRVHNN
jgi:4-amino-4-deoxy-L-arabinose transferase-like glycosyltransferase